jgi:hypothetical protein
MKTLNNTFQNKEKFMMLIHLPEELEEDKGI